MKRSCQHLQLYVLDLHRTEELRKAERKVRHLEHRILSLESQLGEVREELVQQKEESKKQAERHDLEMIQQRKQSERINKELQHHKKSAQTAAEQQSEEMAKMWQAISQAQDQEKKQSKKNCSRQLQAHNCSREGPSVSTRAWLGNIRGAPPAQAIPASQAPRRTTLPKNGNYVSPSGARHFRESELPAEPVRNPRATKGRRQQLHRIN